VNYNFTDFLQKRNEKQISEMTNQEIYYKLLEYIKERADEKTKNESKKKIYYISAEFLIGKLLSNNLINLGIYKEVRDELKAAGKNLSHVEEVETEPSLGNGGLGRLASCFVDSMSTLGINGEGVGLNYHCGLFKQVFRNNEQKAEANYWIEDESWLRDTNIGYDVKFKNFTLHSKLKRIDILGYERDTKNYLNLFDIESIDYNLIKDGISFDEENIEKNLTLFLYPDDSTKKGELLRIYQQYFMVSNAARLIIAEATEKGSNIHDLADYAILAEALEKWPLDYLEEVVPNIVEIIKKLDKIIKDKYSNKKVQIIDDQNRVHMANMDIHFSSSVNGVAYLHTEILKNSELKDFYEIYPEKFNNKTNGITFRRWLESCNEDLADYFKELIGTDYLKDAEQLKELLKFVDDKNVYEKLAQIKHENKIKLKKYLKHTQGIIIDENSIIDTQIKRFHEYKRQQMNTLYVIKKYLDIKNGKLPETKITVLFGGKAAPAYIIAQDIIHLILCLSEIINNDPEVNKYLNVYLVENYNVGLAEKIIPATDISEQISLASKEASGTGNMKFMLNGALTLGTMDGANVEIHDLVGDENIYIFGKQSDEIIKLYETSGYVSKDYYEQEGIKEVVDFITSDELIKVGNKERLERLQNELINKDWFMTLIDFADYCNTKERIFKDYENKDLWYKKVINNMAKAGFFSSDRTIAQYEDEIWKTK